MRRATLNFELKIVYCVRSECHQVCCYKNEVNKCKKHKKCMEMYYRDNLYNRTAKSMKTSRDDGIKQMDGWRDRWDEGRDRGRIEG